MKKLVQIAESNQMQNLIPRQAGLVIVKNVPRCTKNQDSQENDSSCKKRNRPC